MQDIILTRIDGETLEQCLWRLGSIKKSGQSSITWNHITDFLNDEFDLMHGESAYRKKYKRLARAAAVRDVEAIYDGDYSATTKHNLRELEKQRVLINEEKNAYRRDLRQEAQTDAFITQLTEAIKKYEPIKFVAEQKADSPNAIYAMLSDIHYGLTFNSYYNKYSPEIAQQRVMSYAQRLCDIGEQHSATTICVSLLGDLISGNIHTPIRIENRGNAISQVVGVSELIASFLYQLANHFSEVIVTNVSGNHSRIEQNPESALRAERLDALIPWYCKAKLEKVENIKFYDNELDPTISVIHIYDKTYVAVHGDYDPDMKTSATRISQLIGKKVDYFLAGHMHVADMRIEDIGYIRNGAVVTGGDEYTSKKRLFGPAAQVCLVVNSNGVEAVYPVLL